MSKLIICRGIQGSGKSTFGNIICKIFDNDTAALNLSDLSDDFKLASGIDKRLIYSTEINSDEINKIALDGALKLYLDFINLFIYLLRIFGNNK